MIHLNKFKNNAVTTNLPQICHEYFNFYSRSQEFVGGFIQYIYTILNDINLFNISTGVTGSY